MRYLPLFFDIAGKNCLVVGAGGIAARKVELLLNAAAIVTVVAGKIGPAVTSMAQQSLIHCRQTRFRSSDLNDMALVIAATNDPDINAQISLEATKLRIPVNIVDNPDLCSFIMPSIVDRDPVQIAISTGASSPVLARLLRRRVESIIPGAYGDLARLADEFRDRVKMQIPDLAGRRKFWEEILEGQVAELVFDRQYTAATSLLDELLNSSARTVARQGEVYLIAAGFDDVEELTLKALRLMQKSDVVIYDQQVSLPMINLVRRDAEKLLLQVHTIENESNVSEDCYSYMQRQAALGKRVMRLVGGTRADFENVREEFSKNLDRKFSMQILPGVRPA